LSLPLECIRHVAMDMDGTIYLGRTLFPETRPFLNLLADLNIGYTFLTNNSSRNTSDYLSRLSEMGIEAKAENIYSSIDATIAYLKKEAPSVSRLFVLGTSSMKEAFSAASFELCGNNPDDEPDAVVVGFDTSLQFKDLCSAAYWIRLNKAYIATHPDSTCPTDERTVLIDCGSVCAALAQATGRKPDAVPGKPDPNMLVGLMARLGLKPEELAVIGDRLHTDMAMAQNVGALSVLTLTGETTADMATAAPNPPDLIVSNLAVFGKRLEAAKI